MEKNLGLVHITLWPGETMKCSRCACEVKDGQGLALVIGGPAAGVSDDLNYFVQDRLCKPCFREGGK